MIYSLLWRFTATFICTCSKCERAVLPTKRVMSPNERITPYATAATFLLRSWSSEQLAHKARGRITVHPVNGCRHSEAMRPCNFPFGRAISFKRNSSITIRFSTIARSTKIERKSFNVCHRLAISPQSVAPAKHAGLMM